MTNKVAKAEAFLTKVGLTKAWELFKAETPASGVAVAPTLTLKDMVGKLVQYGSVNDKQVNFLRVLVDRVEKADETNARRDAERLAAKPVPVTSGRVAVEGTVLTTKEVFGPYGNAVKMLVKHDDGWKLWGTKPASLQVEVGDRVTFEATVEVSKDDDRFGFFSRPNKAAVLATAVAA